MQPLLWPEKDPDEVLDYKLDWAARLDGDVISTSTWTVPDGITKDDDDMADDHTIIWLSGGTAGATYDLTNRIVTEGGRTMDQTVRLVIAVR